MLTNVGKTIKVHSSEYKNQLLGYLLSFTEDDTIFRYNNMT